MSHVISIVNTGLARHGATPHPARQPASGPDLQIVVATTTDEIGDLTRAAGGRQGVHIVAGSRGRGAQMNAGARIATGDWLLFLHGLGYEQIVLVGSDLPTLPPALLARALHTLRTRAADVVLGPAADGGYFLIACAARSMVCLQTRERARALGLSVDMIDAWYDVDDAATLRGAAQESRDSRVAAWWRSHAAGGD